MGKCITNVYVYFKESVQCSTNRTDQYEYRVFIFVTKLMFSRFINSTNVNFFLIYDLIHQFFRELFEFAICLIMSSVKNNETEFL